MTTTKEHKNNNNKIPFVFPLIFCLTAICSKGPFAVSMYPGYEYTRSIGKYRNLSILNSYVTLTEIKKKKKKKKKKSKESHNIIYKMCPTIFVTLKLIY